MSPGQVVRQQPIGWSQRAALFVCMALIVLSGHRSQSQGSPPGLNYFKNFFVTGNYVGASVDFGSQSGGGGFVTAVINFDDPSELVPDDADVVGAFLYWQTIASGPLPTTGLTFRGQDITSIAKEVTSAALDPNFSPCWSGGGQGTYSMKTFRADVRRFLPVKTNQNGVPLGKTLVNDADLLANGFPLHEVRLPDNGTGNQTPQTAGASLIVIYRLPTEPLTSIVLYDGLQLKTNVMPTTSQILRGFYQASANPFAKLTLLVGSGAKNATEQVSFNGLNIPGATNPFFTRESNSPGSDRAWDGPTWDVGAQMPSTPVPTDYGEEVTVQVTHTDVNPYDCLATSAIVFSTEVEDTDFDGLLNVWETGDVSDVVPTHSPLLEPTGQALPNLYAMGADPNVQDIFVEVGFMRAPGAYNDPLNQPPATVPAHTHMPSQIVLDDVAAVFTNAAQRRNPADPNETKSGAIKVHFDVGDVYQASPNVVKYKHADGLTNCSAITDPACLARGGEEITETELCPATQQSPSCDFPGFRGVVGWKGGFRMLRDQPLLNLNNSSVPTEAQCVALGPQCVRRFDENRRHMFRYVLFAHALGVARVQPDDPNTPFHEDRFPRSVSGVADGANGGGDVMITLGLWDNFTGTEHMQKATLVHEFGHTAGLRHGGSAPKEDNPAPNCMPNYQSVMNYLYQVRGVIGQSKSQTGPTTVPVIDYSRQVLQLVNPGPPSQLEDLDESSLTETALKQGNAVALHPPRWYAPKAGSFLDNLAGTTASTRHCDGSPLNATNNPADAIEMVRVDATDPAAAIDWNASGTITSSAYPQDINFNGDGVNTSLDPAADGQFKGWNDWEHLDLRQTGSRRNPGVLTLEISLDELSANDPSWNDPSWNDPTWNDPSWNDPSWNDPTWNDPAWNDPSWNQEIDETQARSQGPGPNSLSFTTTNRSIDLKWNNPPAGGLVQSYHVFRALGVISPTNQPTDITPGGVSPTAICNATTGARFCDTSALNNRDYYYFVVAWFANGNKARSEIIKARR
jgi:hypothetical protein